MTRHLGTPAALFLALGTLLAFTGTAAAAALTIPIDPQNGSGIAGTATLTDLGMGRRASTSPSAASRAAPPPRRTSTWAPAPPSTRRSSTR